MSKRKRSWLLLKIPLQEEEGIGQQAKAKVAKISNRIQNLRDGFLDQVSRKLADSADIIVFENLNIKGMLKNHHLAKHIQDYAWGKLIQLTQSKAAKAGKVVELVDARYMSQKCSQFGIGVLKTLVERTHACPNCGLEMDRDLNDSLNIRILGLRGRDYRDTAYNQPVNEVVSPGL